MRVLVAALFGGIVMFIWGAVAHMALGLGEVGMRQPVAEDTVLAILRLIEEEALKRGRRLDESKPGTGLGLSIVSEITNEYQGRFELSRGSWGGLRASLILPGLMKDVA